MELTKNGINCTNIKKDFPEIQILDLRKRLIYRAKQRVLDKKPHCKRLQGRVIFFEKNVVLKIYV
jgi:hypothetical protein